MLVELEKPFVWPEEIKDFAQWDKDTYDAAQKEQEEFSKSLRLDAKEKPSKERAGIAEQARALLEGKEKWKSSAEVTRDIWEDVGEAVEVEKDVTIPRS